MRRFRRGKKNSLVWYCLFDGSKSANPPEPAAKMRISTFEEGVVNSLVYGEEHCILAERGHDFHHGLVLAPVESTDPPFLAVTGENNTAAAEPETQSKNGR